MWRATWLWALAAVLILLGAGSMVLLTIGDDPQTARAEGGGDGVSSVVAASEDADPQGAGKPEAQGAAPAPSPTFDLSRLKQGNLELELVVEPACAKRGDAMTAKLKAVPGAYVSLIVSYADGQSFGTWYAGPTLPDGTLTYPWVVPPNAALGQGYAFASGADPATERSGTVAASFRIAGAKGC